MLGKGQFYYVDVHHEGLKKYKRIKGYNKQEVTQRAEEQWEMWEQMWQRQQELEQNKLDAVAKKQARERAAQKKEGKKQIAIEQTKHRMRLRRLKTHYNIL